MMISNAGSGGVAISVRQELLDVDNEFMDNHEDILDRFYQLFDGIYKVSFHIFLLRIALID